MGPTNPHQPTKGAALTTFTRTTLALLLLSATHVHAQTCTPNTTQQLATQTLNLQSRLLAATVPSMDTDIPAPVRPVLHNFKQSLINTVDSALDCNNPDPTQLGPNLAALLHANRPTRPDTIPDAKVGAPVTDIYGRDLHIAVKPVPTQPDLFSIQLTYGIMCGDDNILLLYRRTPTGYQRALIWQNPDLNSVGDAMGDQFLYTPAPGPVPAWTIVYGSPWCSSNSSMLHADLLVLATPATVQRRSDHLDHDYRRDWPVQLTPEPDGFELHANVDSVSGDLVFRPAVLRYTTTSGHFVQQPVAPNAQAFVDLWLESKWPVVAHWSDPASQPRLNKIHDELTGESSFAMVQDFGATLTCSGHFQVEIDLEADHTTAQLQIINLPSRYAQVRANTNSFTLLDITDKPDPTCHGPDLMKHR